jgi:hypothetical protein
MELYFLASGVKHDLDLFEAYMQTMPFNLPITEDGLVKVQPIFGMLSPINLYRFIFPKEELDTVINTLGLVEPEKAYPMFNMQAAALRKIMGAKKLPKPKGKKRRLYPDINVGLKAIGYKEDKEISYCGVTHEGI